MNILNGGKGESRTHTNITVHWILSPVRLPVPPQSHMKSTNGR